MGEPKTRSSGGSTEVLPHVVPPSGNIWLQPSARRRARRRAVGASPQRWNHLVDVDILAPDMVVGYGDFWRFVVFCSVYFNFFGYEQIDPNVCWRLVAGSSWCKSLQLRPFCAASYAWHKVRLNAEDPERRICFTSSGVLTPMISDSLKLLWGYIRSWCTIFFATSLLPPRTFLKSQLNKHMNPILEIDLMINSKFSQSTFHYISSIWLYPQIRSEHSEVDAISQKTHHNDQSVGIDPC